MNQLVSFFVGSVGPSSRRRIGVPRGPVIAAVLVALAAVMTAGQSFADEKSDCALAICQEECSEDKLPFLDACLYCDISKGNCETEACITQFEGCLPGEICPLLYDEMVNGLCIQSNTHAGCIQEKLEAGECCDVGTNTCCDEVECATNYPETSCSEAGTCMDGACEVLLKPDGESCSDGTYCNGEETCLSGVCTAGVAVECSDGEACNGTETCTESGCVAGTPMDCDDGIACTEDSCSASLCVHVADDTNCSPGLSCSTSMGCTGCGDGITDSGEECDTAGSSPTCDSDCTTPVCGDGLANPEAGEVCDGADLGGHTCESQGSATGSVGVLLCDECSFDTSACDADADGVPDAEDLCPSYDDVTDADGDGVPDGCDDCPADAVDDSDEDGYCASDDCDDDDPHRNPSGTEVCNGVDDNCDGRIDEGLECEPTEAPGGAPGEIPAGGGGSGAEGTGAANGSGAHGSGANGSVEEPMATGMGGVEPIDADSSGDGVAAESDGGCSCSNSSLRLRSSLGAIWFLALLAGAGLRRRGAFSAR